ncbi:MAG TPA: carbon-nitrogen hydrolase family protein [Bacillales bacterium]|nr:carbon-nitrogen hydrolase family protein [Bacillales bacterium]
MKNFVAAAVQIAVEPNQVTSNINKALKWLERAVAEHKADLVVFPETITTGFNPNLSPEQLYDLIDEVDGEQTKPIREAARELSVHVVWPTYTRGPKRGFVYNSSLLIDAKGEIVGVYHKTHPFPSERRAGGGWAEAGSTACVYETELGNIGMIICYDGDFPELARLLALNGAEVIVRPSALMRSFDIWDLTTRARAYDNHVYMIGTNAVGPDAGGAYYFGHSMIVDPTAWKLAQARGTEEIISAELDSDPLKYITKGSRAPMTFDHLEDRNLDVYRELLKEGKSRFEPAIRIPYKRRSE